MVRLIKGQYACEASLWVAGCFGHVFSMKLSVFNEMVAYQELFYALLQHFITHLHTNDNEKR